MSLVGKHFNNTNQCNGFMLRIVGECSILCIIVVCVVELLLLFKSRLQNQRFKGCKGFKGLMRFREFKGFKGFIWLIGLKGFKTNYNTRLKTTARFAQCPIVNWPIVQCPIVLLSYALIERVICRQTCPRPSRASRQE